MSGWDLGNGDYDWKAVFHNLDYNNDMRVSVNEHYNAMMRAEYDDETMMKIWTMQMKVGDKEGNLDPDQYMTLVDELKREMEMSEGEDMNRGGPRMEMNMEKLPDGTERMTIVMEGAKKLAFSAAAVAAASFFAM